MTAISQPAVRVPSSVLVRAIVGVQMFFWIGYLIVCGLAVLAAIDYGGFGFWPFGQGDMRDPKDVLGLGGVGALLHIPLQLNVLFGFVPAVLTLIGAIPALFFLWRGRADAAGRWPLTISTAITTACLVAHLSPFGSLVVQWMLD